jgi:hypothetical protein
MPHSREGRFDGIRGAQVNPVGSWVVVEREQLVDIVGDLRDRLGKLRPYAA